MHPIETMYKTTLLTTVFCLFLLGTTHVNGELLLLDEWLEDLFWCGKPRCCLEYDVDVWDTYNYNHTNECTTDEECNHVAITLNGCGHVRNRFDSYISGTQFYCMPMGNEGRSYCTLGCKIYKQRACTLPGTVIDSYAGTMDYCYFYYNDVTEAINPVCPCLRKNCDTFGACATNPILTNIPPPTPSPPPIPSPSPTPSPAPE